MKINISVEFDDSQLDDATRANLEDKVHAAVDGAVEAVLTEATVDALLNSGESEITVNIKL
jgi:hypothetical protein